MPLHHVQDGEDVQIAVPRRILQTGLRREAHRRVYRPAAIHRAHRRASAQVTAHQLAVPAEHLRHTLADILMRGAVEPVLRHAVGEPLPGTP